ncbi:DUF1349 domain-containing protein [Terribacillus saccharophilus]|uniref:DUF1349 domain-containing protein n=1 Tax=Terribacillus saccharophilus TaxID=361277 RepID=A0A268ACF2_9BACI|nr:DUF1349 domain-containing protein [Terribacillus saccharophilus]PAD21804.1 hypothetical protein CHH64_06990 [Terribacillus saccharophilus]PAF21836.1 hypothetical protein CHH49_09415 [Terribacillus saccharophilus]
MAKPVLLEEKFESEEFNSLLQWRYEPQTWFVDKQNSQLVLKTDPETDFWQKTHYGFENDNGHFLYLKTEKNFRMTTKVKAQPNSKYDHAGLMIRYSKDVWVKSSLEYITASLSKLGVVVTNQGFSDWSTQYVKDKEIDLYFRISRINQNCYMDFSWDGEEWMQMRIAHLDISADAPISAGLFACSPQGKDQTVRFDFLTIEELSSDPNEAYL